jgi:HK97 family phage major capsid protein
MSKFTIEQIRERLQNEGEQIRIRSIEVDREAAVDEDMVLPMSVSSEFEVETWYGFEILDHKRSSIIMDRFNDGGSLRDTHGGDQVGNIQKPKIDAGQKKLRVDARFSKHNERANLLYKDYRDGYRKNVSLSFIVHEIVLEREVDGVAYYRVTKWEPLHVALVPDPADPSVGVGRSNGEPEIIPLNLDGNPEEQIEKFNRENNKGIQIKLFNDNKRSKVMTEIKTPEQTDAELQTAIDRAVKESGEKEAKRIANISACARDFKAQFKFDLEAEATKYIQENRTYEDFFTMIRSKLKEPDALATPNTHVGLSEQQKRDYSLRNIILYQLGKVEEKEVGMELEASRALSKQLNKTTRGIFIPDEIMNRRREINLNKLTPRERDLVVGTDASGGYLVKDQYVAQSFIEMLQNASVFIRSGVEILPGLIGDVPMNRELDNYTYYWVGEGSGPTKSSITFGQEKMTPKKGGALAKYSYEFLQQSGIAVEAYIERRLALTCALGADRAVGYGSGSANQPKGLKNWTGIGSGVGAGFDRSKALAMEGQLYTANAQDLGTMKWISKGTTRAILKDRRIDAGSGLFLCNDANQMIGHDYSMVSNQVDAGDLFFGIWNQIILGYWNEVEILANPFDATGYPAGDILVRALQSLDVFVSNPAAFSLADGVN